MKHMEGDLIELAREGHFNYIVHGCNCFCTMGKGIARQIKKEFPAAYAADCLTYYGERSKLGTYSIMYGPITVINAYTQYDFAKGYDGNGDYFEYEAFQKILDRLVKEHGHRNFGFPYIGMGLAGGDKDRILGMLQGFADAVKAKGGSVTLVKYPMNRILRKETA